MLFEEGVPGPPKLVAVETPAAVFPSADVVSPPPPAKENQSELKGDISVHLNRKLKTVKRPEK